MAGKRKRAAAANKLSPEEQYNVERADRYRTLLKFCEKQVRKESKAVKTFEAQKIVKRLKLLGGEGGAGNGADSGDANSVSIEANDKMKRAQENIDEAQKDIDFAEGKARRSVAIHLLSQEEMDGLLTQEDKMKCEQDLAEAAERYKTTCPLYGK